MKTISLYKDLATPMHQLAPLTKVAYVMVILLLPVIWQNRWVTLGGILLTILLLSLGKVLRKAMSILGCYALIIFIVLIIQGLFNSHNQTPLLEIGGITFYKEGMLIALGVGLNVSHLLLSFSLLILTTKPSDLVEALVRKGLSPRIGYVLSSVFQIIPQMSASMATITDAQRARGMETEGKLLVRLKAFLPLIGPVVMNALIGTRERAIALEVRGFNSHEKKSFLNEVKPMKVDYLVTSLLIGVLVLSIMGRVVLWQYFK